MESQSMKRFWRRRNFNRLFAFVLALVMVFGSVPDHMMSVRAESGTELSGETVSGNAGDVQNSEEGGDGSGISMLAEGETVTETKVSISSVGTKTLTWTGSSPVLVNITDLFTLSGVTFNGMTVNVDYSVTIDATNMPSVTGYPYYNGDYRKIYLNPTAAGSVTVALDVFDNASKGIVGAESTATIVMEKGELSDVVKGEYFLDFGGYTTAEYGNSLTETDIKVIDNNGNQCTGNVTYTYYKVVDGVSTKIDSFPKDIGTYVVEAQINADLWNSFSISKSLEIIPKKIYLDVNATTHQYGLVDANDNDETIVYTVEGAKVAEDGIITIDSTSKSGDRSYGVMEGDVLTLSCSSNVTGATTPGQYWIYVVDNSDNYEVMVNRDTTTGLGYVTITKRNVTAEWPEDGKYTLEHTNAEQKVTPVLNNYLAGDDVSLVVAENVKTDIGSYTASVTGLTGDAAAYYNLTNASEASPLTQAWKIVYATDANMGEATISGTSAAAEGDATKWYSGTVTLNAKTGYEITLDDTYKTGWAPTLDVTEELTDGVATTLTYYIRQAATGIIVGKYDVTINYDETAPTGSVTFKNVTTQTKVTPSAVAKFFINKATEVAYTSTDSASDISKVEYAVLGLGTEIGANTTWKTATDGEFTITPANNVTGATLASNADCGLGEYVIYVRITDKAGNQTTISTDTIVVFDGMTAKTVDENSAWHGEYQVAAGTSVTVALVPDSANPFASGDAYIGAVTISDGTTTKTLEAADYSYDANGKITLNKTAFDGLTVGIGGFYSVSVTLRPFGNDWCAAYDANAVTNDVLGNVAISVKAIKSDASITLKVADAVYDGATFDGFEVELGQEGGIQKNYYAVYNASNTDYTGYVWQEGLPTNVGKYVIKAAVEFTDSELYNNAAAYGTFEISKAAATATVVVDNKTYDGTTNATITSVTVVANGVTGKTLTLSGITAAFETASAGEDKNVVLNTVGVTATGDALENYDIEYVAKEATITKKDITLAVSDIAITYGEDVASKVAAIAQSNVTINALATGDTYADLGLSFATNAVKGSNVGSYPITLASDWDNTNYNVTAVTGYVVISPLVVEVTWSDDTSYYFKDGAYTMEATVTNALEVVALTYSGDTSASAIGTYTATITGVDNINYTIAGNTNLSKDWSIKQYEPAADEWLNVAYGWYNFSDSANVNINADADYSIRVYTTAGTPGEATWVDTFSMAKGAYADGEHTFYYQMKTKNGGYITAEKSFTVSVDTIAPEGTITVGTGDTAKGFGARLVNAVMSLFYKEQVVVTIDASDVTSGMATDGVSYAVLTTPLADGATIADEDWTSYTGQKTINSNSKVYVYAKLTDAAGNSVVINTDGIVVYKDSAYAGTDAKEEYTKYSGADVAVAFTFNANTIKSVVIKDATDAVVKTLTTDDYTVNTESIVIKGTALDTLSTAGDADSTEYKVVVSVNPLGVEMPSTYTGVAPTDVVVPMTVSKAAATVTAEAYTKTYDGSAVADTAIEFTTTNKDENQVVTYTYYDANDAVISAPKDAGTYKVKVSVAETDNYLAATSEAAVITIEKKAVNGTITIKDKTYDGTTVATVDSVSIATGVDADVFSYNTGSAAAFSFADKNVAENIAVSLNENSSYADLVTGPDINNYDVTYTVSAADITKASLSLTIGDMEAVYGDAIDVSLAAGTLTVTGSGMENGELVKDIVAVSYAPTEKLVAGTHNITLDKFAVTSANYDVSLSAPAKLVITKRPITLKWQATNEKFTDAFALTADSNVLTYNAYDYVIGIAEYENVVAGDTVTAIVDSKATVPGSYTATAGELSNVNYMYKDAATSTFAWNIKYLDDVDANYKQVSVTSADWYSGDVSFAPSYGTGSTISTDGKNDATATWAEKLTITAEGKTTGQYAIKSSEGYITSLMDYTALIDKTAPTADITVDFDEDKSETFVANLLETITFGMFSVADVTVTVTTSDVNGTLDVSGVDKVYYQITDSAAYVDETAKWTEYNEAIKLTNDSKNVVFVKVVDKAGNFKVYNTDGIVVYTNSTATIPTVGTDSNAFAGYEVQRADAADITLAVTLNGNTLAGVTCDGTTLVKDTDYTFADGTLTLKKAFVASLRANDTATADVDEGMHAISLSFNPQGETFGADSKGEAPTTIDFSIKMIKKPGKVVLYSDYATENVYNGTFVALPLIQETLSSGVPTYQFKEQSANAYTNSRPKDAGTYTVKVTVPEDDYYMAASAELSFTIAPKALTVVVPVADKVYDGTLTASKDGTMSVDTGIAGESFTVAGDVEVAFADKNVGTEKAVAITGTDAVVITPANDNTNKANYTFSYAADAAAITAKAVTVSVVPVTKTYGDENPAFTLSETAEGLVNGETVSDIGTITLVTTADQYTGIGSYDVTLDEEATSVANYTVTVDGDNALTINPRPVSLVWPTADELKLTYNAKPQKVTAEVTEVIGNDVVQLTYKNNEFTAKGSYTADVTAVSPANYTIAGVNNLTANWSIDYLIVDDAAVVKGTDGATVLGWYNDEVTICPPTGYYIATSNTSADAGWLEAVAYDEEAATANGNTFTYYLKSIADGTITDAMNLNVKLDMTAPGGKIAIRELNFFETIVNKITFNMFYKNDAVVKITANESLSGIATIEYMLAESYDEYSAKKDTASNWTVVNGLNEVSFPVTDLKAAVFARITDVAGNTVELNSDGMVVYKDSTVVSDTAEFIKATQDDVVIQAELHQNTVESVVIGRETLVPGEDYEVVEDTAKEGFHKITLKNSYLAQLKAGEYGVVINYNPLGSKFLPGVSTGDAPASTMITLTVSKNTLTADDVQVADMSKVYDGQQVWADVTTISMGGVDVEYKAADAADTTYSPEAPRNVGEYVARITVREDDNYAEYIFTEEFEITKAELTVNIIPVQTMYGEEVPELMANVDFSKVGMGDSYEDLMITLKAEGLTYSETRVNAGKYNVTGSSTNGNYTMTFVGGENALVVEPKCVEIEWSAFELTYTAKEQSVTAKAVNLFGNDTCEVTVINGTKSALGEYTATATALSNSNYTLEMAGNTEWFWGINFAQSDAEATLSGGETVNDWYTSDVDVVAPQGYKISTQYASAEEALWSDKLTVSTEGENEVVYYLQNQADGTITWERWITVAVDKTAPTGTITVKENVFKTLLNTVSFGLFFKDSVDVVIDGGDEVSGIATVEYQRVDAGKSLNENGWKRGYEFEIAKNVASTIYARITDNAGHVTTICSDGIVVYTDAAQITADVSYAKLSEKDVTASVRLNDNTIKAIVNGEKALVADTDYTVDANGNITFKASYLETLAAGSYTLTISYNPLGLTYVEAEGNDAPANTTLVLAVTKAESLVESLVDADDFAKVYDGAAVAEPTVEANEQSQKLTYEYKVKGAADSTYAATAPTEAGDYTVRVTAAENDYYVAKTITIDFTIAKKAVTVKADNQTVEEDGALVESKYVVSAGALVSGHSIASAKLTADTSVITENGKIEISNVVINDANAKDVTANYEITCEAGSLIVTRNRSFDAADITVELAKYGYEVGEKIDSKDIKVKVTYKKDGFVEYLDSFITNAGELDMDTAGIKTLVVTYTFDGVQCSEEFSIDVSAEQGDVGFEILQNGEIPAIVLNTPVDQVKDDVLTDEEKQQVEGGASFNIYLEMGGEVSDADKALVQTLIGKMTIGSCMDISMYKKVGLGEVVSVHELDNKLMLTIKLPQELILKSSTLVRDYFVVRVHEGVAEYLPTYYNAAEQTITFNTEKFSTYAITYMDRYVGAPDTGKDDVSEGSGDDTTGDVVEDTTGNTSGNASAGSTSGGHKSPKTGDEAVPFVGMLSIITLLGAMLIYKKSYVEKN